jgi:hypothetical protein
VLGDGRRAVFRRTAPAHRRHLGRVAGPSHVRSSSREEPTELLTPAGVSYEMALAANFRTMGDDMPTGFGLNYLNTRITPGLPEPAQA